METKKYLIKKLLIRLGLIYISIIIFFFMITFPIAIYRGIFIYNNKDNYRKGILTVEKFYTDRYGSCEQYAYGYVEKNIYVEANVGWECDGGKLKDNYPVLYTPNSKYAFLITENFKFNPTKYLIYSILELICLPIFLFILYKIYKYFKNDKIIL